MTEPFKLSLESEDRHDGVVIWMIRIGVALTFIVYGMEKLTAAPGSSWVVLFERIGLGEWFRYATGAAQLTGATLLVIPRTTIVGAAALASTMVGAIVVNCFVLHSVATAIIPGMLLAAIVVVGIPRR